MLLDICLAHKVWLFLLSRCSDINAEGLAKCCLEMHRPSSQVGIPSCVPWRLRRCMDTYKHVHDHILTPRDARRRGRPHTRPQTYAHTREPTFGMETILPGDVVHFGRSRGQGCRQLLHLLGNAAHTAEVRQAALCCTALSTRLWTHAACSRAWWMKQAHLMWSKAYGTWSWWSLCSLKKPTCNDPMHKANAAVRSFATFHEMMDQLKWAVRCNEGAGAVRKLNPHPTPEQYE